MVSNICLNKLLEQSNKKVSLCKNFNLYPQMSISHVYQMCYMSDEGDLESVRKLVDEGHDIDERGLEGTTPLMCAAGKDHKFVVEFLLEHKVDLNAISDTALHLAVYSGHKLTQ